MPQQPLGTTQFESRLCSSQLTSLDSAMSIKNSRKGLWLIEALRVPVCGAGAAESSDVGEERSDMGYM